MFSDPSGLAPEKENRTMAPSYGGLGASISGGYWNEISTKVLSGKVAIGLDNPLAPAQRRNVYGTDISYEWMESAAIGGGSGGGGGSSGGGNSSSGKSSRRGNNEGNLNRKSHQEKNRVDNVSRPKLRNTFYVNQGGRDLLESHFGVKLDINKSEFDLFEVSGFEITDNRFNKFHDKLSKMINNSDIPLILSTNQDMNLSKNGKNIATFKSVYGASTAFIDLNTNSKYVSFDGEEYNYRLGQTVAHELFGHIYNYFVEITMYAFGMNTESNAVNIENYYLSIFGYPQRSIYGPDTPLINKFIKKY